MLLRPVQPERDAGVDHRGHPGRTEGDPIAARVARPHGDHIVDFRAYLEARRAAGQPAILDLGCGARKVPDAFGIDAVSLPGVDLVHDLKATPYPLPESCADQIFLTHVLEHFENPLPIMEERSEEHTSELQSLAYLVCRLLLEKKKKGTKLQDTGHRLNARTSAQASVVHKDHAN